MFQTGKRNARLLALFLLGAALFHFPLLAVFNVRATVFGIPLLYSYLFGAWLVLIILMAWSMERGSRPSDRD